MTADYTPQVGDRVRRESWSASTPSVDVTAIGSYRFLGVDRDGEFPYDMDGEWVKVVEPTPLPERWANVYPDGVGLDYARRSGTDEVTRVNERIAVLHIWTDADGVDHGEIERVTQ